MPTFQRQRFPREIRAGARLLGSVAPVPDALQLGPALLYHAFNRYGDPIVDSRGVPRLFDRVSDAEGAVRVVAASECSSTELIAWMRALLDESDGVRAAGHLAQIRNAVRDRQRPATGCEL